MKDAMASAGIQSGLVSVTFRKLAPRRIVELARQARLGGIEWGGDIHVPPGDMRTAVQVARWTADAGLAVAAYGSYYRAGADIEQAPFAAVLDSALALGAPLIRVWAGRGGSAEASIQQRKAVAADLRDICRQAQAHGLSVALEYHEQTLTDTLESTQTLLADAAHPNLRTLWQPRHGMSTERCVGEIEGLLPHLSNLHVFHWWPTAKERHPLEEGADRWQAFLAAAGPARYALLEFVRGEDPEQFLSDARALHRLLEARTDGVSLA